MLAGFAEREYTPAEGVVPGQIEKLYANGKGTPLMAHAAVFENEGSGAVLVQLDVLFVSTEFAVKMRKKISEITGYPYEQVWLNCSHTHTGCAMDCDVWDFKGAPENVAVIEEKIVEAVKAAYEGRADSKLGIATGYDDRFNYCRDFYTKYGYLVCNPGGSKYEGMLVKPYAAIDHTVNVMRVDDMEGKPKCFIFNYANHLDTNPSKAKFDADFPGYVRRELQKEYGEDVTVLFLNGCCANINHLDFVNKYHKTHHCRPGVLPPEEIGVGLADTIMKLEEKLVATETDVNIQGKSRMHLTTRRRANEEMKKWGRELMARIEAGEEVKLQPKLLAELYLGEEIDPPSDTMDFEISVLQIGPWTIVGLPGEIYSDIGLKIKANSPFANTIIVEIVNGYNGYVSTDLIQFSRCYEGRYSNVAYTGLGTDKVLIDGATNMLNALFDADNVKAFGELKPDNR